MYKPFDELTPKQQERVSKFILSSFAFSEEQLNALSGDSEMTYDIFRSCLDVCVEINEPGEFCSIMDRFPEMAAIFDKEIEELLEIANKDPEILSMTAEAISSK